MLSSAIKKWMQSGTFFLGHIARSQPKTESGERQKRMVKVEVEFFLDMESLLHSHIWSWNWLFFLRSANAITWTLSWMETFEVKIARLKEVKPFFDMQVFYCEKSIRFTVLVAIIVWQLRDDSDGAQFNRRKTHYIYKCRRLHQLLWRTRTQNPAIQLDSSLGNDVIHCKD